MPPTLSGRGVANRSPLFLIAVDQRYSTHPEVLHAHVAVRAGPQAAPVSPPCSLADLWRDEGATFNDAYDLKPDAPAGPSGADGPGEPEGDGK